MPTRRLFKFRKTEAVDKNTVVFKKSDGKITEVSVACVKKSELVTDPTKGQQGQDHIILDPSQFRSMLKERDAQILSLTNEVEQLRTKLEKLETQAQACRCGAHQNSSSRDGPNMKWKHSLWK
mmetsp:Transcript_18509/g.26144  ORF Transcript_18509/g.26144 Transcript_18509/m.26144 type:complete len:123 (+) Transcript_18509:208-576(+)